MMARKRRPPADAGPVLLPMPEGPAEVPQATPEPALAREPGWEYHSEWAALGDIQEALARLGREGYEHYLVIEEKRDMRRGDPEKGEPYKISGAVLFFKRRAR